LSAASKGVDNGLTEKFKFKIKTVISLEAGNGFFYALLYALFNINPQWFEIFERRSR